MSNLWSAITAICTAISMVAFVLSALYVRAQLAAIEKERYLSVTNDLFVIWQSKEFMEAQLWLLHRMDVVTWQEFIEQHRADMGEAAFHRVGGFYDRVGALVRLGLVDEKEILTTIGAYAIATWQKIEPLVKEARKLENSALLGDFERLVPACYECYVPSLGVKSRVRPFELQQSQDLISISALRKRLATPDPPLLLDVRRPAQVESSPQILPGAMLLPPDDVEVRLPELPHNRDIVVYCA